MGRWAALFVLASLLLSCGGVLALRWLEPPWSAVMLQRTLVEGEALRQTWVDLADIDPHMALAVVASEDQLFPQHSGFDADQIMAALAEYRDGGRLRGASTISQQVARNLFLWQGRSFVRKGLEVWFTAMIELLWDKRRILEMYLNFAETGPRMFGVAVASRDYFDRSAAELNRQQAALIAAVLPNPVLFRVDAPSDYVRKRQRWILTQMRNLGGPAYLDGILNPADEG
ncbi:MAG: monofunctional biosynthetic peptidoglycan transglycosylase [Gammaproteobacteria bacterium]|nr:monofunctional biosynthetic peptidoglycan transglycosylase [Gammaproteobacteria bacterium]